MSVAFSTLLQAGSDQAASEVGRRVPGQSARRKGRSSGLGMSLRLRDLCSHPAIWAGVDRARLNMSEFSRPRWAGRPPHVDRCHLSSLDAINHHAARNHARQAW